MLIARAYRHTEKLLLDNRDKLVLVSHVQRNITVCIYLALNVYLINTVVSNAYTWVHSKAKTTVS